MGQWHIYVIDTYIYLLSLNSACLRFLDSRGFHRYKMLKKIKSVDMVSLLSYLVHAASGEVCLYFAEFCVYGRNDLDYFNA